MKKRKLKRKRGQRRALLKSLIRELILREKIITTEAKAKETARIFQKLVEKAKSEKESQRRKLLEWVKDDALKKLIYEIGPRYKERKGGYVRVIKLDRRISDGAKMAILELV
jgi:large subunit ribosomal protein L17